MSDKPTAFHDLPEDKFPFTVKAFRTDTDEEVWSVEVHGPAVLEVPALKKQLGVECRIEAHFADGQVVHSA